MESKDWKKKLTDAKRCGSCIFVEGGWEHEFEDGHKDIGYFCSLNKLIFSLDFPPIALIEKTPSDTTPVVHHYQKGCPSYRSIHEFELVPLTKEDIQNLDWDLREMIEEPTNEDLVPYFVVAKGESHEKRSHTETSASSSENEG